MGYTTQDKIAAAERIRLVCDALTSTEEESARLEGLLTVLAIKGVQAGVLPVSALAEVGVFPA